MMKNKLVYILILCMFIFYNCKDNPVKPSVEKQNLENNLPYTSEQIKKYYRFNNDESAYILDIKDNLLNFTQNEINISIKENDFDIKPNTKSKYLNVEAFNFSNNNSCKLILYNTYGENDIQVLSVQLNSYKGNLLIDQLLLDNRFTFETEYYRTFTINKDGTIKIKKYSVDNLEYNESGDIIGKKQKPEITETIVEYKIDNDGKFVKI